MATELHSTTKSFLEWGRLALIHRAGEQRFSEQLEKAVFSHKGLDLQLRNDLDLIIKNARNALDFISQPDILDLTDEDPSWEEALGAFKKLDRLVYFMEAAEKLLPQKNKKLADELLTIAADAYEHVSSFFFSSDFSALRLTVFQKHRIKALKDIPPEQHYLFPWYDLYSHVEPDSLPLIAENLNRPENLPEDIKDHIPVFLADIQTDKVLSNYIQEQQLFSRDLGKMFETHWSLRLLRFVEQINLDKVLPEMVEQKGVARLIRSLEQGSTLSVQDRFALGLSAALFAPNIDEAERLNLLEQCENIYDRIKETPIPDNPAGRVTQGLNHFMQGRLSLEEAVQATLDYWIEQLNAVQAEDRVSKADMAGLVRSIISVEDSDEDEKIKYRPQKPSSSTEKEESRPWLEKLKSWFGKPVVLVPALAVFLILVSVQLLFRQEDPMHMNLQMLVYQTQPLTRSDEAETVITKESGAVLSAKDCFQLLFTPTRDVYAYLLHQDIEGRVTKYFEGQLYKDQTRVFPDEESRACFTEDSGLEVFYLVYFDDAVDGFDELAYQLSKTDYLIDPDHFVQEITALFPNAQIEKFKFSYK